MRGCRGRSARPGAAPLLPDRLKLDSCRSLMPPCRVAGRVGVSARGVPGSFFPACTTTATSPRYGVRSTPRSFKFCRERERQRREHQQPRGAGGGGRIGRAGPGKGRAMLGLGRGLRMGRGHSGRCWAGCGAPAAKRCQGRSRGGGRWVALAEQPLAPSPRPSRAEPSQAKPSQAKSSQAHAMPCAPPSHTELPTSAPVLAIITVTVPEPLPLQHQHHAVTPACPCSHSVGTQ